MSKQTQLSKQTQSLEAAVFCGIDVSAATLAVCIIESEGLGQHRQFGNEARRHKALIKWLHHWGTVVRVSLEATGVYSLDLALALDKAPGIELAVLNPKVVNRFAQTLRRSKTDAADAMVLAEYSRRMPFTAWQAPSVEGLQLRAISRHIASLSVEHARAHNRLHAARSCTSTPRCVLEDLKRSMGSIQRRIARLRAEALRMIQQDCGMGGRFRLLIGVPGIGPVSAMQILGELVLLAPQMTARQWVAYSGLDPVHQISGASVHKASHISRSGSRYLRRALYMPALAAVRWDPHMRAFYEALQARHKTKLQALIAVARKILHAIHGIFRTGTPYDGHKLFPALLTVQDNNPLPVLT